jgi:HEAT repeat protein
MTVAAGLVLAAALAMAQGPLTSVEQGELDTLVRQLADPGRSPQTKVEAAELLLTRTYPQAAAAVVEFLNSPTNRAARLAIAQAIAKNGAAGGGQFAQPLMAMLTGDDAALLAPAAEALARCGDPKVLESLLAQAGDPKADRNVRLAVVRAMAKVLDKQVVDVLVRLLDDPAPAVGQAAAGALARMTNIRSFGTDAGQWKAWWSANKHKTRTQWLEDLADALARSQRETEQELTVVRDRLRKALADLYAATPADNRYARLTEFLKDPLADVRLEGLALTDARVVSGEAVGADVRRRVEELLGDADWRVRAAAGPVLANLAEPEAVDRLLARLKDEETPEVRAGLLTAVGLLRDPKALPAVVPEIGSRHDKVSAAAATAMGQIAAKAPMTEETRARAAGLLAQRYNMAASTGDGAPLREKLLTAISIVGRVEFLGLLQQALKDTDASVRLAGVTGLARLGDPQIVGSLGALADDSDRGVRRAVIVALASASGGEGLPLILKRTEPAVESEATVRQQAWEEAMKLLDKAGADAMTRTVDALASRPDAIEERIQILKKLVALQESSKAPGLPGTQRKLGEATLAAKQPAEAAVHLGKAYLAMRQTKDAAAPGVWREWVHALLAADDPGVAGAIAAQPDKALLDQAVGWLEERLGELDRKKSYAAIILLTAEAQKGLTGRLTKEQASLLSEARQQALSKQQADDIQRVAQAVGKLVGGEEPLRKKAQADLQAMGDRAVRPLLGELLKTIQAEPVNVPLEKAIMAIVRESAPKLTGYDPAAAREDRVKLVEKWLAE